MNPAEGQGQRMSEWKDIESAPKDGTRVDLWGKIWISDKDSFEWRRFADCYWMKGDSMTNRVERWVNFPDCWRPTHWMPLPDPPEDAK